MQHFNGRRALAAYALVAISAVAAWAWHAPAHDRATRTALAGMEKELPAFFMAGADTIAHCSADPDLFRLRENPELRDAEVPEHFFDLELLGGAAVPPTRSAFVALCAQKGIKPSQVGFLPYAIVEWTQRLTIALAEHRKWPDNKQIQEKCLVYAGILSHYAQDACQPLHTTIHYDGRVGPDGASPGSGIHAKMDALLQKLPPQQKPPRFEAAVLEKLLPGVLAEICRSHALVEKVYQLEVELPAAEAPLPADSKAAQFARELLGDCATFSASLYLTAWRNSGLLKLPEWHQRAATKQ